MKICADCKHSEKEDPKGVLKCNAPENMDRNRVTGAYERRWYHCEFLRDYGWLNCRKSNTCGKEGRWFKPKERPQSRPLDF